MQQDDKRWEACDKNSAAGTLGKCLGSVSALLAGFTFLQGEIRYGQTRESLDILRMALHVPLNAHIDLSYS